MRLRRALTTAVAALAASGVALPAYAAWSSSGSATLIADAGALGPVAAASAGNATATSLDLSWTSPTSPSPASFDITRDGIAIACDFAATGLGSAKCRDTFASSGTARTFTYSVTPRLGLWRGPAQTFTGSAAVTAYTGPALALLNPKMKGADVTATCSAVAQNRTCNALSGSTGNSRSFTFNIGLINADGTVRTNTSGSAIAVSFTQTGGSTPADASVVNNSSSTGTVTFTLPNGSSSGRITATATVGGTTVTIATDVS